MSREIPQPIRAYVGLAATVLDEARKLPGALPGLPVRAVGLAMQTALKVQQSWAGLVARGDEVLTGLRGEDEPGLATFDDDVDLIDVPAAPSARASAFDRAAADVPDHDDDLAVEETAAALDETDAVLTLVDDEDAEALQDVTDQVAAAEAEFAPTEAESVLTAEDALESALLETDGTPGGPADDATGVEITEVDVLTPDGEIATVQATITDEAIAAPESPADLEPADQGPAPVTEADAETAAEPAAEAGSEPAGGAPIAGYDAWTVAQLRGRLRGYQLSTVADLVAYEEATRAREPFLRMLRNRLEKLERQAVEASPLAPRGL